MRCRSANKVNMPNDRIDAKKENHSIGAKSLGLNHLAHRAYKLYPGSHINTSTVHGRQQNGCDRYYWIKDGISSTYDLSLLRQLVTYFLRHFNISYLQDRDGTGYLWPCEGFSPRYKPGDNTNQPDDAYRSAGVVHIL